PAYWPWLQLVRELVADGDADVRAAGAALLERPPASELGVDARFRLFDAVAGGFAAASRKRPLLLVLDDLHWADEASIRLLEFLRVEGGLDGLEHGPGWSVPTGVRAVVTRRLSKLSSVTGEVIAAASVVGADIEPSILGPVTGLGGEEVLAALREAEAAGL